MGAAGGPMRALSSSRLDREPVRIVQEPVRVSVWAVVFGWLARRLARLLIAVLRSPSACAVLAVLVAGIWLWQVYGPTPVLVSLGVLVILLTGWRLRWPRSFERWVRWTVRGWWRGGLIYRLRWATATTSAGLSRIRNQTEYLPVLGKVSCTWSVDRVRFGCSPVRPWTTGPP